MSCWRSFVFLAFSLSLLSCGSSPPQPTAKIPELRVGLEEAPKTLDPRFATDAYGMQISQNLLFSTLVQLDEELQITPSLASSWESPNNRTYIFHLRPEVVFHDGTPLTAEDVKFTFEHLMEPALASPFGPHYRDLIERIDVVDPHTVTFVLKQPTASFLTAVIMAILPRHLLTKPDDFADRLIGSGPFKLVSRDGNEIVLEPFAAYYAGPPALARLVFKVVKDDNTRYLKMQKGELDLLINGLPLDKVDDFNKPPLNRDYQMLESPGVSYNYLAFNLQDPALQDQRLRQAIDIGIDRAQIIEYRLKGHAKPASGLLSPLNWCYDAGIKSSERNPEQARALLEAAGYPDPDGSGPKPRLTLEFKSSNNNQVIGIARILQAQLAEIGIRLEIKAYEWGTFYGDIQKGNFQLTAMRWVGVTDPDFYFDLFHSEQDPPAGRNRGRYRNPEIDRLVLAGRTTLEPEKRKAIYAEVQRLIARDLPYISLWHANNISIVNRRVSGYRPHPMGGFVSFKDITVE